GDQPGLTPGRSAPTRFTKRPGPGLGAPSPRKYGRKCSMTARIVSGGRPGLGPAPRHTRSRERSMASQQIWSKVSDKFAHILVLRGQEVQLLKVSGMSM